MVATDLQPALWNTFEFLDATNPSASGATAGAGCMIVADTGLVAIFDPQWNESTLKVALDLLALREEFQRLGIEHLAR